MKEETVMLIDNWCEECQKSTARCWRHSTRYFTVGPDGQLVEVGPPPQAAPSITLGWTCPRCGQCWSPIVSKCDCFPAMTTTSSTSFFVVDDATGQVD